MPDPVFDGKGAASLARNFSFLLGGRGAYFVTRFVYAIILARVFGPQLYGMINYGIALYLLFLPLTRMGLDLVLSRDVGRNKQDGDRTALITLTLRIGSIALVTAVYLVFSCLSEEDPLSRLLACIFAFALVGRSLAFWTESMYAAYEVNHYSFRQQSIFRLLEIFVGLPVIIIWRDALLVAVVHGFVWCLEAFYGLVLIHRRILPLQLERKLSDLGCIFIQGLPLGAGLLLMAFIFQGPLICYRHLNSVGDSMGQLALAMQVFFMLSQVMLALGSVSMPVLSRSVARKDGKDGVFAETALRYSLLTGTVLALSGSALGSWLTIEIFGEKYAQAGGLLGHALWLMIPWATGHALSRVVLARKLDSQFLLCSLIGAMLFALSISQAVSRYDTIGAIWSGCLGMTVTTSLLIVVLRGHLILDLKASLIKPGLAAVPAICIFYSLHSLQAVNSVLSLVGSVAVLAIACCITGCVTQQDKTWFKESFRWVAKRIFPGM